jgi:8-oxo-dGTP diphosphatase
VFAADEEISDVRWLPAAAAGAQLTYPRDRDVLARHVALPPVTGAVLVIRHGYAGSRSEWDGPDDERPLDERGRAQAVAMAQVLTWYAPERVLSAPAVRCVQSAQPLAFVTGVPVEIDPVLSEDFHRRDERATAARIRELGSTGLTTAIVSQGKVIPEAIAQIAADDGLGLRKVASRKGSAWALFFSGSRLIAADYRNDLETSPR